MVAGNATIIDALMWVKANLDAGIPQAIQRMAIAALEGPRTTSTNTTGSTSGGETGWWVRSRSWGCGWGRRRRASPAARRSLYLWARVPEATTSVQLATRLMDEAAAVVTPGIGYAPSGEGYVRLSLTIPDDRLEESVRRMQSLAGACAK